MPSLSESAPDRADGGSRYLLACVLRSMAAAGAVMILGLGVGVAIWALTPEAGEVLPVLRASVAAVGAANFLSPSIGGVSITLAPLLLTLVCVFVVASAADRSRGAGVSVGLEWLGSAVVGLTYGAVLTAVVTAFAPTGSTQVSRAWAPVVLGLVAAGLGTAARSPSWRARWRELAPEALRVGVRAGVAAICVLLLGGAVAVALGLLTAFGTAIDLSSMTAPSSGEGLGMLLLSLAFLPNAIVAGLGYSLGGGFQIGSGTYSPLGTSGIDLAAMPLLAAVPDSGGISWTGLLLGGFPVVAAVGIGWYVVRHLAFRRSRVAAAGIAGVLAAIAVALIAATAGGGVRGSHWANLVVPAPIAAAVALAVLVGVGGSIAAMAGWGSTAWSAVAAVDDESDGGESASRHEDQLHEDQLGSDEPAAESGAEGSGPEGSGAEGSGAEISGPEGSGPEISGTEISDAEISDNVITGEIPRADRGPAAER